MAQQSHRGSWTYVANLLNENRDVDFVPIVKIDTCPGGLTFGALIRYKSRMLSILNSLSATQLKRAVAIKEQIEKLETELASICVATPAVVPDSAPKKRRMSAARKAQLAAARKARWAKKRANQAPPAVAKAAVKPKRTLSPAVRAKLAASANAYWAKVKAARG